MKGISNVGAVLTLAVTLTLAGCGKGGNNGSSNTNAPGATNQAAQSSVPPDPKAELDQEKTMALDDANFAAPILLRIDHDDTNDVANFNPANPPACMSDPTGWAGIDGYTFSGTGLSQWLVTVGIISVAPFPSDGTGQSHCRTITEKVRPYLTANSIPYGDIHKGVNVPILRRQCAYWQYVNSYEADLPGKGKVKMFAGTYEFDLVPLVPWVTTNGFGTAQVKMYLDPDTGRWVSQTQINNGQVTMSLLNDPNAPLHHGPDPHFCPGPGAAR